MLSLAAIRAFSRPMILPESFGFRFFMSASRKAHFKLSLKNILLIPVLPLIGYFCLDATGVTDMVIHHNPIMQRIMGEGFGHAGLCFSLHYVLQAGRHFWLGLVGAQPEAHSHEPCC